MAVDGSQAPNELLRSISEYASAVQVDARVGIPAKTTRLRLAPAGLALLQAKTSDAYQWSEVREIAVRRGSIVVTTEAPREKLVRKKEEVQVVAYTEKRSRAMRVLIDGVPEPSLVPAFARILEDMRTAKFSYNGTSWIEYQNAVDRAHTEFLHQDDMVLPAGAAGMWAAVGLLAMALIPLATNAANARAIPAGAFSISDPLGAFDPRSVIAGFALSALITSVVMRFALGKPWPVWARGASRGWARRDNARYLRLAVRQLGRILLASSSAAVIFLLALLSYWPNIAATVIVAQDGVRNEVLLPFISLEESWKRAVAVTREPGGVTIRFSDGRTASTIGHELGGGTENQLIEVANQWWKAAR